MNPLTQFEFTQEKLDLLKNTVCKGASNHEFELFLHVCKRTGLDPFARQIYAVKRPERQENGSYRESMTIQTGIDGFRLIAERTGKYSPGKEPIFQYDSNGNLISATSYVKKMTSDGTWHEVAATAFYKEYVQLKKDGSPTKFWLKMGHTMTAKCAEAIALRKAFPVEMSGIYTKDEMLQADDNNEDEKCVISTHSEEDIEKKMLDFLTSYPKEDHDLIRTYIQKYSFHYKLSILDALQANSDKDKFESDFNKWKKKQLENN